MTGWLLGRWSARDGQAAPSAALASTGRPLYRDNHGKLFTSDGSNYGFSRPSDKIVRGSGALRAPAATRAATKVMTKATISTRGGFGAVRAASFGG